MHRATATSQTLLRRTLSTSLLQSPSSPATVDQPYLNSSRSGNRCSWLSNFSFRPLFRTLMTTVAIRGTGASTTSGKFNSSRSRSAKASISTTTSTSERTPTDNPEPYVFVNGAHFIIFGLGNPGPKYADTRHNIGRDYVSSLAAKAGSPLSNSFAKCSYSDPVSISLEQVFSSLEQKKKYLRSTKPPSSTALDSTVSPTSTLAPSGAQPPETTNNSEASSKRCLITFATPETYMNLSGDAVKGLSVHLGIPPERIVVLHDDIDVHLGVVKVRASGTSGGQRGIESILNQLSSKSPFIRVRMGVGRPPNSDTAGFVLGKFTPAEKDAIRTNGVSVDSVSTLVKEIIAFGFDKANSKWQAQIRALQKSKTPSAKAASEGLKPYVYDAKRAAKLTRTPRAIPLVLLTALAADDENEDSDEEKERIRASRSKKSHRSEKKKKEQKLNVKSTSLRKNEVLVDVAASEATNSKLELLHESTKTQSVLESSPKFPLTRHQKRSRGKVQMKLSNLDNENQQQKQDSMLNAVLKEMEETLAESSHPSTISM